MSSPSAPPPQDLSPATVAVTAGRPPRVPDGPLNPPIVLASTYHAGGETGYGRYGNPTWEMFEQAVGALEGGLATSYASGIAATAAILDLVPDGGTVVAQEQAYYGTLALLRDLADRGRVQVRAVDLTDLATAAEAIPGADLVWVESPTNPMLHVTDIAAVMSLAAAAGALGVVDNTFATPVLQRPLSDGASVVLHSATKYLSGHSDVLLGVAVVAEPELAARLLATRSRQGSIPGTFEAWLALRGLRTLGVRVRAAQDNARVLAERLATCAGVGTVHYPGTGAMLSFELDGGAGQADLVVGATDLWVNATSLGGVESALERRRRWPGESVQVPESLIRLSVGIEDVEDLWRDLSAAIEAATTPGA
jgi:cystathionine gamma-synthase